MFWFLFKYMILSTLIVLGIVYSNVDWWNEDTRRSLFLLVCWSASFGLATTTYLEKGDWLVWKKVD
jgi:hypothetical protein